VRAVLRANREVLKMAKKKPRPMVELPPGTPRLLDAAQACAALSIRETKLYALIGDGDLPAYKLGDRLVFKPDDVGRLIAALPPAKIKPLRLSRRRRLG
jgi:excisionase family DNA binding protein